MTTLTRTRRRPRRGFRDLESNVNRMLESVFAPMQKWEEDGPSGWPPRMDLSETDDAYHLHMDLPGMTKDDIHVRMQDNRLSVSGERHEESTTEDEDHVHSERYFGSFFRSVRLPASIVEEDIEARFDDGVLTIDLTKMEESKPKRIKIT